MIGCMSLRRTILASVVTMAVVFAALTAVGWFVLLSRQTNQHAQTMFTEHGGRIAWLYARIFVGDLAVGVVVGWFLHPILPGRRAAIGVLLFNAASLVYVLTSGTHLLYGPVHSFVVRMHEATPSVVSDLYAPWQILALFGVVAGVSLWRWSRRVDRRISIAVGLAVVVVIACRAFPSGEVRRPAFGKNLVLIASDSLRADHLGCNGYARATSPHIDALAARGVDFSDCLVPTASTHESWITIFSATPPRTHGLRHMFPSQDRVRSVVEGQTWFPRWLVEHGYHTAVVGGWCGATFETFDVGFQRVDVSNAQNAIALVAEAVFTNHLLSAFFFDHPLGRWMFPELNRVSFTRSAQSLTRRAKDAIDDLASSDAPFLLLVTYHATHLPYSASYPYYSMFRERGYDGRNLYRIDFAIDAMIKRGFDHDLTEREEAHIVNLYDGCVREFDDQVGQIVRHLEERGLIDDTIVGVLADHGDDLYEHGTTLGHGVTLFGGDHANRIPAIFAGPGVERGRVESKLVRSYDLAPTWARWLGLDPPPRWEGVDLGGSVPDLTALLETSYLLYRQPIPDLEPGESPKPFPRWDRATFIDPTFDLNLVLKAEFEDDLLATKCYAVREGRWKLIHVPGEPDPIRRLFDLDEDSECRHDVRREHPDTFARLVRLLPPEARG